MQYFALSGECMSIGRQCRTTPAAIPQGEHGMQGSPLRSPVGRLIAIVFACAGNTALAAETRGSAPTLPTVDVKIGRAHV